jgi:hypothetical protein
VEIELVYQTWDAIDLVRLVLSPSDYFDPLEPGENYQTHGVPRHNHTWQYLNVPLNRLKWSMERRRGTGDDTTFRTQYMDGGRTWMTHRLNPDGYEEIIHYTQLSDNLCHTIRTWRTPGGAWVVSLNSVIRNLPDGSEEELRHDQPWSPEEVAAFTRSCLSEESDAPRNQLR